MQRFNTDMQYVESSREHTTLWWFHNNLYFYPPSYDSTSLHFSLFFNNKCNIYTQFFCCYYYKKKRISLKSLDEICACWCAARDQTVHRYNDIKKKSLFYLIPAGVFGCSSMLNRDDSTSHRCNLYVCFGMFLKTSSNPQKYEK